MNVKLLRKVKDHILEEPKRLFMPCILVEDTRGFDKDRIPPCGTMGCIAGWACFLSGEAADAGGKEAARLLKIDDVQATRLFFDYGGKKYEPAWGGHGTAEEAELIAERIEHFIKTKGQE